MKGFDYKAMAWADLPIADGDSDELMSLVPAETETFEADTLSPAM